MPCAENAAVGMHGGSPPLVLVFPLLISFFLVKKQLGVLQFRKKNVTLNHSRSCEGERMKAVRYSRILKTVENKLLLTEAILCGVCGLIHLLGCFHSGILNNSNYY